MAEVTVRRITLHDAGRIRALHLEMLADSPLAFVETIDEAAARPHEQFRQGLVPKVDGHTAAQFVAESGGRLVGQASGYAPPGMPGLTLIVAVYVSPPWRGTGLLGRFVDTLAGWSRSAGRYRLELEVITHNHRAIRAYEKVGFRDTGLRASHPTIPVLRELRMSRSA